MRNLHVQQQYRLCAPSNSSTLFPWGWQSCGQGNQTRELIWLKNTLTKCLIFATLAGPVSDSFSGQSHKQQLLAQLRAQDRTQLTPVSFILSITIQTLLHRTETLRNVPVRVIRVFGITDVCMAMADTAPSNADIFDAVVILESTRKVGH